MSHTSPPPLVVLALSSSLALVALSPAAPAGDSWPGWRGPTRDGKLPGAWPEKLAGVEKVWRVPLAPSYSGPVVDEERVFVTETVDKKEEVVRALDRETGKDLWTVRWPGAMQVPFFAASNGSWIRSTPAIDDERIYVAGMRDLLVCLEKGSGKEVWRLDYAARPGAELPAFGLVCSPLVAGDHLFVQAGGAVVKLEKRTGKELWRALDEGNGMYGGAFSSPTLADLGGRTQLVVQTRKTLAGLDPADGKVLWSREIPAFRGMNILTPMVVDGGVFTSAYGGTSLFFRVEKQKDLDGFEVREAWTEPSQGYMSTPVEIGGHLYLHLRNQRMACLEAATGKRAWTTTERFGQYMSLVARGDRILALDERGILILIRARPDRFEQLDSRKISESSTWAHLAPAGDRLYVRELDGLAAFRWTDAGGGAKEDP